MNMIARIWRGEFGLAQQFWLIHALPVLALQALSRFIQPVWITPLVYAPVYIVSAHGVWQAARVKPSVWSTLAKTAIVLEVALPALIFAVFGFIFLYTMARAG